MVGPKILGRSRGWDLAWVGGSGFPFTKQCFDDGDGIQLSVAGDHSKVL